MLFEGFSPAFHFTLYTIGVIMALVAIGFVTFGIWRLTQLPRKLLRQSSIVRFFRKARISLTALWRVARINAGNYAADRYALLAVQLSGPRQRINALTASFLNTCRQIPWGLVILALACISSPFLVFATVKMPLESVLGIATAGTLLGIVCAPFTVWLHRLRGVGNVIGTSLLTVLGGTWSSLMLIAVLIAMTSP